MALAKQQFFFPFFLFVNSRYVLLGPGYARYDLLLPLNGQSYPIKIAAWVSGGAGKTLSGGYSLHDERRGSSCLSAAGGRGWAPAPEHPSGRASLQQSIPPSAEHSSSRLQIKDYQQYNLGPGPLIAPHALLPKKIFCWERRGLGAAPLKMGLYGNEWRS